MLVQGKKGPDIAEKMFIGPKVVSAYRSRIYEKLGVKTDVALALLAIRHGIANESTLLNKE